MIQPLDSTFNRAIVDVTARIFPRGYDVADRAPDTFVDLLQHASLTGRMLVWSGASDRTIYADPAVNWAFRAWHDARHISGLHDFTMQGESMACLDQVAELRAMFPCMPERWETLLRLEIIGQASTGGFVADQFAFVANQLRG